LENRETVVADEKILIVDDEDDIRLLLV